MNKNALSVVAALCAASLLCAQGDARFAMKVLPAPNLVVKGPAGTTGSGSADLSVAVSSTEAGVQGWSFGIIVEPGADATMNISSVAMSQASLTAACGKVLGFVDTAYFTSADLTTPVLPKVLADGTPVTGIPDGAAVINRLRKELQGWGWD